MKERHSTMKPPPLSTQRKCVITVLVSSVSAVRCVARCACPGVTLTVPWEDIIPAPVISLSIMLNVNTVIAEESQRNLVFIICQESCLMAVNMIGVALDGF